MTTTTPTGTTQHQRHLPELSVTYVLPNESSTRDLLRFIQKLAHHIRYYDLNNREDGNWSNFVNQIIPQDNKGHTWEELFMPENNALTATQNHPPHQALLITFLKLYQYAQQQFNELPRRYIDFYYRELLGFRPLPAKADTAIVCCTLAKNIAIFKITPNNLFAAPQPGAADLLYSPLSETILNQAQIGALKTIYCQKHQQNDTLRLCARTIADTPKQLAEQQDLDKGSHWALFGECDEKQQTQIGFAIASPVLILSGGKRIIEAAITMDKNEAIKDFNNLFKVELTVADGWREYEQSTSVANTLEGLKITLRLLLQPDFPAIVPYNEAIHQCGYTTQQAVLRITLKNPEDCFCCPEITEFKVQKIELKVTVKDFSDLILQNDLGVLDPTKPIQVFGPVPVKGANFYVGSREVFSKKLTKLSLNIQWRGLPEKFEDHYKGYPEESLKDKANFKIQSHILDKNEWVVEKEMPLFSDIDMKIDSSTSSDFIELPEFDRYTNKLNRGFMRLTLTNPPKAFGHSLYAHVYTATIINIGKDENVIVEGGANVVDTKKIIQDKVKGHIEKYEKNIKENKKAIVEQYVDSVIANTGITIEVDDILKEMEWPKVTIDTNDAGKNLLNSFKTDFNKLMNANNNNGLGALIRRVVDSITSLLGNNTFSDDINKFITEINGTKTLDGVIKALNNMREHLKNVLAQNNLPSDQKSKDEIQELIKELSVLLTKLEADKKCLEEKINYLLGKEKHDAVLKKINAAFTLGDDNKESIGNVDKTSIPNEPYTPTADRISLNYTASDTIIDTTSNSNGKGILSHIHPFGFIDQKSAPHTLLPQDYTKFGGNMYIALQQAQPLQNITIYFYLSPYTAIDIDADPPKPTWYYLCANVWKELDLHLLNDGTFGFTQSGIVTLQLPKDATNNDTLFQPVGNYWLRVQAPQPTDVFDRLRYVQTQAVAVQNIDVPSVRYPDTDNKIKHLVVKTPAITDILQAFPSFGGVAAETDADFYVRVSERLRHKNRCTDIWSYEHWVLGQFPELWAVKAEVQGAYVHLTVVCYPNAARPYKPKCNKALRDRITNAVKAHAAPWITISVENPYYIGVQIDCNITFVKGSDENYYKHELKHFIAQFLSPFNDKRQPAIKAFRTLADLQTTERELLLNELVQLPYIDAINNLSISIRNETVADMQTNTVFIMQQDTDLGNIIIDSFVTTPVVEDGIEYLSVLERDFVIQ